MNKEIEELRKMLKEISNENDEENKEEDKVLIYGDGEKCQVQGTAPQILAELTRIIAIIHNETGIEKDKFETAVEFAFAENEKDLFKIMKGILIEKLGELDE